MSDKYLKEIASELKLIRKALQKSNEPVSITIDGQEISKLLTERSSDPYLLATRQVAFVIREGVICNFRISSFHDCVLWDMYDIQLIALSSQALGAFFMLIFAFFALAGVKDSRLAIS